MTTRTRSKKAIPLEIPSQKTMYTLIGHKQAMAYIKMLFETNYVFTCLPYSDCVRIETYISAPQPLQEWLV